MPFVSELLKYRNKYFIETGTYKGETTQLVADSGFFDIIYTIEYDEGFHAGAVKRFESIPNVHCFRGTSRTDLEFLIKDIQEPITFWLDAHWGGGISGIDDDVKCPILQELEQIKKHPIKTHTIIINDMRLMNGQHFTVTIPEILQKLKEINENYIFLGYDDSECQGDVLVATIKESSPYCIQRYLQVLNVPFLPPETPAFPSGIGDILRGAIAMIQYAEKYNFKFYLDRSCHPAWKWFEPCEYTIDYKINKTDKFFVPHLFMPGGYDQIVQEMEDQFKSGKSFSCTTNSFYTKEDGIFCNGKMTDYARQVMKKLLTPTPQLKNIILEYYKKIDLLPTDQYIVIHLRCGDECIENPDGYMPDMLNYFAAKVQFLLTQHPNKKFVLITDSSATGRILKQILPTLYYTDSTRIHLGNLSPTLEGIEYTLAEMFIIINSSAILANSKSGFSNIPAAIYGQQYECVF